MRSAPAGNPSSAHAAGRKARQALDAARESIAQYLDCSPGEILFTSGATESNNLAILGLAGESPGIVAASPVEHPCVAEPLKHLAGRGWDVKYAPCDGRGYVPPPESVDGVRFAAIMLANHETGAVQPVADWVKALPGVPVHTDAAQAVGKIPVSFRNLGVATLSASAHKFGGPVGAGLLVVRKGVALSPRVFGGPQQSGRRPGTESVILAVGLAAALDESVKEMTSAAQRLTEYRTLFLQLLRNTVGDVAVNGPLPGEPNSLPGAMNLSFPGCRADLLLTALDLAGVNCSTGSACASGSLTPSPVLRAMGLPEELLRSAIRFTFGRGLAAADVTEAAARVAAVVRRVRGGV